MQRIVTLTLSPALDLSTSVDTIEPWRKLRCETPRTDPGGGGINVARALRELGGDPVAVAAIGGHVGSLLADELRAQGIALRRVNVRRATRQNFAVTERSTGRQFRFVHESPAMSPAEWTRVLDATVEQARGAAFVVASSSVPVGVPADAFAVLAERLHAMDVRVVVDTSGPALRHAARAPVEFVKPSINELRAIIDRPVDTLQSCEIAIRELFEQGRCAMVVVSLGADGALFVPRHDDAFVVRPPQITPISTSGAGDSMVAALTLALSRGEPLVDAARFSVAAGTSATLVEGTGLCKLDAVRRLMLETTVAPLQSRATELGAPTCP